MMLKTRRGKYSYSSLNDFCLVNNFISRRVKARNRTKLPGSWYNKLPLYGVFTQLPNLGEIADLSIAIGLVQIVTYRK